MWFLLVVTHRMLMPNYTGYGLCWGWLLETRTKGPMVIKAVLKIRNNHGSQTIKDLVAIRNHGSQF
jgi:hypothetical protein